MMNTLIVAAVKNHDMEFLSRNGLSMIPDRLSVVEDRYNPDYPRLSAYGHRPSYMGYSYQWLSVYWRRDSMCELVVDCVSIDMGDRTLFIVGDQAIHLECI